MGARKYKDGDKVGYFTVLSDTGKRSNHGDIILKLQCECGKIVERRGNSLTFSIKRNCLPSCGCKRDRGIGERNADNPNRIKAMVKSLGQIDGTTMQGMVRKNLNKNNHSGVRGVCFKSREQKWQASICLRGQDIDRKMFNSFDDAVKYRKHLEEKYFKPIIEKYEEQNCGD